MVRTPAFMRFTTLALFLFLLGTAVGTSWAQADIGVVVKTVLASQESEFLDPRLSALIRELQSLFKYSSYRLLSEDHLDLRTQETGSLSLPGDRALLITPLRLIGERVELKLVILKKKQQIFQTVIQLLNGRSLTVGGPQYEDGYLLFNVSAAF